jgi:hypothetical protein
VVKLATARGVIRLRRAARTLGDETA